MAQKTYDKKYGFDSSANKVKDFHKKRRMFVIKDNTLYFAPENVTYSHAEWFELEGWISPQEDKSLNELTRGFVDSDGVYFYKGYDFVVNQDSERTFFKHLSGIVKKLDLDTQMHVYGGMIRQKKAGKWAPRKDYGTIASLLKT